MKDIKVLQDYFAGITYRMLKENNYPNIFKEIFRYGIKNIFIVKSGYNQGIPYNVYYNNKNGKVFTEYYCYKEFYFPADFTFENNMLSFSEAIEVGFVNTDNILNCAKAKRINKINEIDQLPCFNFMDVRYDNIFPLKITVNRGRKFRGEGYLIDAYEVQGMYGCSRVGEIYDPKTNTINECTLDYVEFPNGVLDQYKKYCIDIINSCTFDDINVEELYINENVIRRTSFMNFVKNSLSENIDYSSARNLIKEKAEAKRKEKEEKNKAFKEAKMKDLIEWVKKNTDKEGEEIEKLAERIYKKRYEY
jgi:hypothetical protein